jgi:hypothetical protein
MEENTENTHRDKVNACQYEQAFDIAGLFSAKRFIKFRARHRCAQQVTSELLLARWCEDKGLGWT